MIEPYYDSGGIQIFHGRAEDVLDQLDPRLLPIEEWALVSDPPYEISHANTDRSMMTKSHDPATVAAFKPFDPRWLSRFPWQRMILFGANHYAHLLPPSAGWVVWDKLEGLTSPKRKIGFNDSSDCELIWTDVDQPARIIPLRWMGMLKAVEKDETRDHPVGKPVLLMGKLIEWLCDPSWVIVDPYCGAGSTLRAAKDLGRKAIGVEIEEKYCEVAARRLQQEVLF